MANGAKPFDSKAVAWLSKSLKLNCWAQALRIEAEKSLFMVIVFKFQISNAQKIALLHTNFDSKVFENMAQRAFLTAGTFQAECGALALLRELLDRLSAFLGLHFIAVQVALEACNLKPIKNPR